MISVYIQKWNQEDAPWWCILANILKQFHKIENCPEILTDDMGKPYLSGNPVYFNVSHSGDYLALAVSKHPVGIDLQKVRPVKEGMYRKVVQPEEESLIREAGNQDFIRLWTLKESFVKAEGKGLRIPMKSYYFIKEKEDYFVFWGGQKQSWTFNIEETLVEDYIVSVCGIEKEVSWRVEQE